MIPFNFSNTTTAVRINVSLGKKCIICEGSVIILYYYDMNSVDMRISPFLTISVFSKNTFRYSRTR